MKKILLIILFVYLIISFTNCSWKTQVPQDIGIPRYVKWIEFYNGGLMIARYENPIIETKIDTRNPALGASISFYRYEITFEKNGGKFTEIIVDSEALSMKYMP
jgi:hypothetical protein